MATDWTDPDWTDPNSPRAILARVQAAKELGAGADLTDLRLRADELELDPEWNPAAEPLAPIAASVSVDTSGPPPRLARSLIAVRDEIAHLLRRMRRG